MKYFPEAWSMFQKQQAPFMYELFEIMQQNKPYKGLKILHNLPLTMSCLLKIDCLLMSGADVTIALPKFVISDPETIDLVKKSGLKYIPQHEFSEQYDILLDCCSELADVTSPRIGAVEITQTGARKYRLMQPDYPVVSIDDSQLKFLEDSVGSADGFMRALRQLIKEDLTDQKYVVFGYGKVGIGIARELKKLSSHVTVVDKFPAAVSNAKKQGYYGFHSAEKELIEKQVADAFCVVTASGDKGFVSREYDKSQFANKYLVNIGAEDEFGENFSDDEVFNKKMPVNFLLKQPTKIEYLDPAFYAHNIAIDLLLNNQLNAGVHPLPTSVDEDILNRWFHFHNEDRVEFKNTLLQYVYST